MKKTLIILCLLLFPLFGLAETFHRTINIDIVINSKGSAQIIRTETIPSSALSRVYAEAFSDKSSHFRKSLQEDLTKEFYLLYGTTPIIGDIKVDIDPKGNFSSIIKMKADGLIRKGEKEGFVFARKKMEAADEKIRERLFLKYFEFEIDGRFIESAFLQSGKNSIITTRETRIKFPEQSFIKEIKPIFERGETSTWMVDFGGGSKYQAKLYKEEGSLTLSETLTITGNPPKYLVQESDSVKVLDSLRDYGAFEAIFENNLIKSLTAPVIDKRIQLDFSGTWEHTFSTGERFSKEFRYQTLTVTPGLVLTIKLTASIFWDHGFVRVSTWRWSWKLKKFETTLGFSPSITPFVDVSSSATITKEWSETIFDKSKPISFTVGLVPVTIFLNAKLEAEATASIYGSIGFRVEATYGLSTSIKVSYDYGQGWSKTVTYTPQYQSPTFTANAKIGASAEGRLPLTLAAYIYNIAGPFTKLTPWISGQVNASVGSANEVGYEVKGGFRANGGVQMAGWLQSLCDNLPSVSYEFFSKEWVLSSGTYRF